MKRPTLMLATVLKLACLEFRKLLDEEKLDIERWEQYFTFVLLYIFINK